MTKATYRERVYLELMVPEEPESVIPRVGELTTGRQNGARIAAERPSSHKNGIQSTSSTSPHGANLLKPQCWPPMLYFLQHGHTS